MEIGEKVAALDARQGAHEKQCEERQKTIMDTLGELRGDLKLLRNSMVVFLMGLMTWGALEIWSRRDFVAPSGAITSFARGFLR